MGAAARGCETGAERVLPHLRERFAEAFPGEGAAADAGALAEAGDGGSTSAGLRGPYVLASAPGRLEVAGNHVDHQGGRVISAAIGERTWGLASENGTSLVRVSMEGFGADAIDLGQEGWRDPRSAEEGTSRALVRGMLAAYDEAGGVLRGFDLATCSDVPSGCGLSSSAAFEVMVGAVLEGLFGPGPFGAVRSNAGALAESAGLKEGAAPDSAAFVPLDPVALALAGVTAEQRYFGKPCGAQDQLASACGGVVLLDFAPKTPTVTPIAFDADSAGYAIVLIDSRQDHSAYNDQFAAIPADMYEVARALGAARLGDATAEALLARLQELREALGDGRIMRALHYYDEVARVDRQRQALEDGDFSLFLKNVQLSGASSAQFLQNVSPRDAKEHQPAMLILALCAHLLGDTGAWRIHGGGFGGSVLVFVPRDEAAGFMETMDGLLGYPACREVSVGGPGALARRLS